MSKKSKSASKPKGKGATKAQTKSNPDLVPLSQMDKEKNAASKKAKKLSCLDGAVEVLKAEGKPLNCKAMIDGMFSRKLWHSDAPTPAATLYSAILREIGSKKSEARFKKIDRGQFALKE